MNAGQRLDRNGGAHRGREQVNAAGAEQSLEDWVLSIAPACPPQTVLDLGCGSGKLSLPYARAVGLTGSVVGVDIAPDSIAELARVAREEQLSQLESQVGDLDGVVEAQAARRFDLIVSSYAIYYAIDQTRLLIALGGLLNDAGRVFICGPGEGTNQEMAQLVRSVSQDRQGSPDGLADFISADTIQRLAHAYGGVETHRLANAIHFDRPDTLLRWWRNHSSYVPADDEAVERTVDEYYRCHSDFRLTKNVLGVLLRA